MRDDIFEYLISLGFTSKEVKQFEKSNSEIIKDVATGNYQLPF